MPQLAVGVEFLSEFAKLEPPIRRRTVEALEKFGEHTHAGLHLEKLSGVRDERVRTIRITDYWRGVVLAPTTGDRYVLLRVLGHDEAIDWARRHRLTVNEVSGVLEVRDVAALEALTTDSSQPAEYRQLFAGISDGDFRELGVDAQVVAAARTIADEDELDKVAPLIPDAQSEVLYGLASGMTVEQVWADIVAPRIPTEPVDVDDLSTAAERTQGRIALVDGPDDLLALFDKPFALWRVFLHPSQETVAYRPSYWGSAQVTGGPGTGKTVAALHRVKHLVTSRDLPPRSILLTTFSRALADALDRDITQLLEPSDRRAVEVVNVDRWAHGVVRAEHGALRIANENELAEHMRTAAGVAPFNATFLLDEWREVVLGNNPSDLDGYLDVPRRGRGKRLTATQRRQVWAVLDTFTQRLRDSGSWTYLTVANEAAKLLAARKQPPFRHIVVDEIQDLHPVQWRLLRAAVPVGPDDLFLAGDPHQRIYGNRVSLRQVGITVTGRSTRLRINYRTSAEILQWALGILGDTAIADLDQGLDTLSGYRSTLHGEPPELAGSSSPDDEAEQLRKALHRWHADGVAWADIAVVARTSKLARRLTRNLDVATTDLHGGADDAVRVGTMHGMKGMEFRCVAVVGAGRSHLPNHSAVTPQSEDLVRNALDLQQERCLLFVACTRARERLRISWSGSASALLPD